MVEILVELHLASARNENLLALPPTVRTAILAKYGLDEVQFESIMQHYADHPQAYTDLYTSVLDRLSAERAVQNPPPDDLPTTAFNQDAE